MLIPIRIMPGDTLIREGEPSDCLYILKSGDLIVSKFAEGKPTQLGNIKPGESVGEMSFLDNLPRSATVKAVTPCELWMINRPQFEQELAKSGVFIQTILKALSGRLRRADKKLLT